MTDYARMYRLGFTPWERYGPVAGARLRSWLHRELRERPVRGDLASSSHMSAHMTTGSKITAVLLSPVRYRTQALAA